METETNLLRQIIKNQEMIIKKLEEKIGIYENLRQKSKAIIDSALKTQ